MNNGIELAALEPAEQVDRPDHVGELAFLQVAPLAVGAQAVIHRDVSAARLVEAGNHIRSDESRPAGHQNQQRIQFVGRPGRALPLPHSVRRRNLGKGPW